MCSFHCPAQSLQGITGDETAYSVLWSTQGSTQDGFITLDHDVLSKGLRHWNPTMIALHAHTVLREDPGCQESTKP